MWIKNNLYAYPQSLWACPRQGAKAAQATALASASPDRRFQQIQAPILALLRIGAGWPMLDWHAARSGVRSATLRPRIWCRSRKCRGPYSTIARLSGLAAGYGPRLFGVAFTEAVIRKVAIPPRLPRRSTT